MNMEEFIKLDAETQRNLIHSMISNYYSTISNTRHVQNTMSSSLLNNQHQTFESGLAIRMNQDESNLNLFQKALLHPFHTNHTNTTPNSTRSDVCINCIHSPSENVRSPSDETPVTMLKLDIFDFYQSYLNTQLDSNRQSAMNHRTLDNTSCGFECENTNLHFIRNQDANTVLNNSSNHFHASHTLQSTSNFQIPSPIMNCLLNPVSDSSQQDESPTLSIRNVLELRSASNSSSSPTASCILPFQNMFNERKPAETQPDETNSSSLTENSQTYPIDGKKPKLPKPSKSCTNKSFYFKDYSKVKVNSSNNSRFPMTETKLNTPENTSHKRRRGFPPTKITKSTAKQSTMQFHFPLWTFHSSSSIKK